MLIPKSKGGLPKASPSPRGRPGLVFGLALVAISSLSVLVASCSADELSSRDETSDATGTGGRAPGLEIVPGSGLGGAGAEAPPVTIIRSLPDGFSPADPEHESGKGGFLVAGPLSEVQAQEGECGNVLRVVVRDFESSHDDFDSPNDWSSFEVVSPIGPSRKPEKTSSNGPLHFDDWYRFVDGENLQFAVDLWLEPVAETFVFDSQAFFPINGWGFDDSYSFTTELHTRFQYGGGEVFTFRGDDDVFVFINGNVAVNLSGVHDAQSATVDLDQKATDFGLEVGKNYTFDLFQAERHPGGSNFRLETTLDFTGCGEVLSSDLTQ